MRKHEKHLSMWMVLLLIAAMLIGTTGIAERQSLWSTRPICLVRTKP